jgi:23S rRNA pseudouridine1911/1915/1917 synthase
MSEESISMEVPSLLSGVRVDRGVAMVADVSRTVAARLIAGGRVLVDDVVVTVGRTFLKEGSTLTVRLPEPGEDQVEPEAGVLFRVVHADDEVAVVDKPAGLVVHPGAGHQGGTLVGGLLSRFPDLADLAASGVCAADRPGIVHRLDKGTSGLLAVARTPAAYQSLVGQLAERTMERRYLALVEGEVADERGEIDAPIGRSARTPTKMAIAAGGKPARTGYTVRERRDGPPSTTLVELALQSGRTHQIRVHMAAIGHPVVGDARYGTPDKRLGSGRFFLHAFHLAFTHPATGERMEFDSPLPEDLEAYRS